MAKRTIRFNLDRLLLPKQKEIWQKLKRFNVIAAGRRFGKTRFATLFLLVKALGRRGVYWWISPSYKMMRPPWRMMRAMATRLTGCTISLTERTITLPNGSIIEFRSADDPQSLVGEGLCGVVFDECAKVPELAWTESVRAALADNQGWAIFIGTPKGKNWFYTIFKLGEIDDGKNPDWKSFTFTSYDNPRIPASEIDAAKELLPAIVFQQEFMAQFVQAEGSIFKSDSYKLRAKPGQQYIAYYMSVDTAQAVSGAASYTSILVGGLTPEYKLVPVKVHRKRLEFPQLQAELEMIAQQYMQNNLLRAIIVETKSAGLSLVQNMKKTSPPEMAALLRPFNPKSTGSTRIDSATKVSQRKLIAAYEASVWGERGMLMLPEPGEAVPWLAEFEDEFFDFPSSVHNDQVDSLTQLVHFMQNYLAEGYRAIKQQEPDLLEESHAQFG